MKFSKFVHVLEIDPSVVALFHSISLATIYTTIPKNKFSKFYSSLPQKRIEKYFHNYGDIDLVLFKNLQNKKYFVSDEYKENNIINNIFDLNTNKLNINTAYFMITNSCNLQCKYCVVVNNKKLQKNQTMSYEKVTEYLEYFYKNHDRMAEEINISIYGGEPLLYPNLIFRIWEETNRIFGISSKKVNFIILTNALLFDSEILNFLKNDNIQVVVSLDGDKETTNANRVDKKGRGAYEKIVKNLKILDNNNIKYSISATIGIGNENNTFSTFKHIIDNTGAKNIGLNYIMDVDNYKRTTTKYAKKVTEGLIEIHKTYHSTDVYEDRLSRKIKAYKDKLPIIKDCTGCGKQIVFTPDNKIGPCQSFYSEKMYFNEFKNDKELIDLSFSKWNKITPFNKKDCQDCIALGSCGGGCPFRAYKNNGDINSIDDIFCIHSKMLIEHLIKFSYFSKIKNKK